MKPDFEKIAERIVSVDVEDRTHSDNLAIVLCTYFSGHIERPDGDEDDMDEGGWSPWTIEKYHGAKKLLSSYVTEALRAAYAAGMERAAEIADNTFMGDAVADAIRAEKEADHG
jgi:hypothetical protein